MANTKSAIKRVRRISRQTEVNKSRKSKFRSSLKKMNALIDNVKFFFRRDLETFYPELAA